MGELLGNLNDPRNLALSAAAASSAAVTDLVETARTQDGAFTVAANLRFREAAENAADALQSIASIELADEALDPERREALEGVLSGVTRFLEGWAS